MKIDTPIQLYRHILRSLKVLPDEIKQHYIHHARSNFRNHADEIDKERIKQIMDRAVSDTKFIIDKYKSR